MVARYSDLPLDEQAVISLIANRNDDEWSASTFKRLMRLTGLSRKAVRSACRSLRDKGFARHERGLMTEDGEVVGSGYTATPQGSRLFLDHWDGATHA